MNQIVADIIDFVNEPDSTPSTLTPGVDSLGRRPLRVVCINLARWWRRSTLLTSRHPYMSINPSHEWCQNLESLIAMTPSLARIVEVSSGRCCFVNDFTDEQIAEINSYTRDNYQPALRT